jgi:hypothetical protein
LGDPQRWSGQLRTYKYHNILVVIEEGLEFSVGSARGKENNAYILKKA